MPNIGDRGFRSISLDNVYLWHRRLLSSLSIDSTCSQIAREAVKFPIWEAGPVTLSNG